MKLSCQLVLISIGLIFLNGCAPQLNKPCACAGMNQAQSSKKKNNPLKVSLYTKSIPKKPYTIVGEESISKFNQGGIKRQEAYIRYAMSELAAAMGGDAVINIKSDNKSITGTVVAFEENNLPLSGKPIRQKT